MAAAIADNAVNVRIGAPIGISCAAKSDTETAHHKRQCPGVGPGIARVSYQIELSAVEDFKASTLEVD